MTGLCVVWMCGVVDVVNGDENVSGRGYQELFWMLFCFVGEFFLWGSVFVFCFVARFVPGLRLFVRCLCVCFLFACFILFYCVFLRVCCCCCCFFAPPKFSINLRASFPPDYISLRAALSSTNTQHQYARPVLPPLHLFG